MTGMVALDEEAEDAGTGQVGAGSDGSETGSKSTASTAGSAVELMRGAELARRELESAGCWARAMTVMRSRHEAATT